MWACARSLASTPEKDYKPLHYSSGATSDERLCCVSTAAATAEAGSGHLFWMKKVNAIASRATCASFLSIIIMFYEVLEGAFHSNQFNCIHLPFRMGGNGIFPWLALLAINWVSLFTQLETSHEGHSMHIVHTNKTRTNSKNTSLLRVPHSQLCKTLDACALDNRTKFGPMKEQTIILFNRINNSDNNLILSTWSLVDHPSIAATQHTSAMRYTIVTK